MASGSSGAPPLPAGGLLPEQQQQQLLAAASTYPALCAGMESSPTGSCAGQQGSLADWMAQHNPDDMEQQLQQLWTAAASAGQPCPAGPDSAAFGCVAAGNTHLMLSKDSTQQQAGWPPVAGQAGQNGPAADVWGAPPQQQQHQRWESRLQPRGMACGSPPAVHSRLLLQQQQQRTAAALGCSWVLRLLQQQQQRQTAARPHSWGLHLLQQQQLTAALGCSWGLPNLGQNP